MFNKNLAIVIPAYNEKKTLTKVVLNCIKYGSIILVNDFSSDNSIKNLKKLKLKKLKILNNSSKLGYDASIDKGINFSLKKRFKYIMTYDADDQFFHSDINKFLKHLKRGYHIVLGVRPYKQRFIENIYASILQKKYKIRDPFCGFKAYNKKIFINNKSLYTFNSIGTEILLKNLKNLKKIKQLKISIKPRLDKSRFGNIFTSNYKLLLAIINGYKILRLTNN